MMKKSEGFSLIELLVVVAIIGVLAAVGITGYQSYINNTRLDVTKTNAESVERWLSSTQIARSGGLTIDPADCGPGETGGLEDCFDDLSSSSSLPFNKFKNAFQSGTGSIPLVAYNDNSSVGARLAADDACANDNATWFVSNVKAANTSGAPTSFNGVVVIQSLSDNSTSDLLNVTNNNIRVGWCNGEGNFKVVSDNITF